MSKKSSRKNKNTVPTSPKQDDNVHVQQSVEFSGPLPPPSILAKYEQINPGFANRIVSLAESEAEHRRDLEEKMVAADIETLKQSVNERRLGQIFAFAIGTIRIISGTYAAIHGAQIAGSFIGTGGVIGLVSVFIYGRKEKPPQKENNQK